MTVEYVTAKMYLAALAAVAVLVTIAAAIKTV
jgi:hypothetical protein